MIDNMSGDILSEILLAAVTLTLAWRGMARHPAVTLGMGFIGAAAMLGIFSFAGIAETAGPHRFLSLLAACAGFPLLATGLRWPTDAVSVRASAAARFALIAGAVGVLLVVTLQFALWSQIVPAAAALLILVTALQTKRATAIVGAIVLIACFALSLAHWTLAPLDSTQQFHGLLAMSMALLGLDAACEKKRT